MELELFSRRLLHRSLHEPPSPMVLPHEPPPSPPPLEIDSPVSLHLRNFPVPELEWRLEIECPLEQQKQPLEMERLLHEPPHVPPPSPLPLELESPV